MNHLIRVHVIGFRDSEVSLVDMALVVEVRELFTAAYGSGDTGGL